MEETQTNTNTDTENKKKTDPAVQRLRKISRCVQTLLQVEGEEITSKQVMELLADKDLSDNVDPVALKEEVKAQIPNLPQPAQISTSSERREALETYMSSHWDDVKDNEVVRSALFNAYCQGRYSKEHREGMKSELLARLNGDAPDSSTVSSGDDTSDAPSDGKDLDF